MNSLSQIKKILNEKDLRIIHSKAVEACEKFKQSEAELIRALQQVDQFKVYRFLGYQSLYQYALQALDLSEHQAYTFITVCRKSIEVPALLLALENKEITITNAKKISSVINENNQIEWLKMGGELNSSELDKALASYSPKFRGPEHLRYINDHEIEMKITIKEETFKKLKRLKELSKSNGSYEELLDEAVSYYIEKMDPVKKAERKIEAYTNKNELVLKREQTVSGDKEKLDLGVKDILKVEIKEKLEIDVKAKENLNIKTNKTPVRKALPNLIKHQIYKRSLGQCEIIRNSKRCTDKVFLEIHHLKPLNLGGTDELSNLIHICSGHHKVMHWDLTQNTNSLGKSYPL